MKPEQNSHIRALKKQIGELLAEVEIRKVSDEGFVADEIEKPTMPEPLKISIGTDKGFVTVLYSRPITSLVMTKKEAKEYARRINKEALK